MAKLGLQYKVVADICDRLVADDTNPSYTLVAAELEGNPSKPKVLKHIATWREARITETTLDMMISPEHIKSLVDEIAIHVKHGVEKEGERVAAAKSQADDAMAELVITEQKLEQVSEDLATERSLLLEERRLRGEEAAGAKATITGLETSLGEYKDELKAREKELNQAHIDLAVAGSNGELELEKEKNRANLAALELQRLKEKLEVLEKKSLSKK